MNETLQIIVSVAAVGVVVLVAVAGATWRLADRLAKMESRFEVRFQRTEERMDNLAAVIGGLSQQVVALTTLMSLVFTYFHRSNIITDEEYRENMGQFTANISLGSSHLVDYLIQGTNPLSSDEAHRLKELVDRAGRGEIFLRPEVREYKTLIAKVKRDHPYDPRVWQLVTLGTLMSGVYLNEPEEEPE